MRILAPLRRRDFALLWGGLTVSFLGDGVYIVALPFQVYALSNTPSALALVGFGWSAGLVAFLLVGGILADRKDRRRVMMAADALRLVSLALMGSLAVADALSVWHMTVLAVFYGAGQGLFTPAFGALVPDLVPEEELVPANAIHQFVHPLAMQLVGPALGGVLVAATNPGTALLVDAGTFAVSLACVAAIRARPRPTAAERPSALREMREGLAYVRTQPWLWATLVAIALTIVVSAGPVEVLLPYQVQTELGGDARDFGLIMATAGLGGICGSAWIGQRGLPRRPIIAMYASWSLASLPIAGYGFASEIWQLMALAFVFGIGLAVGNVIWGVITQTRVPRHLRGRVSSLDWFVSLSLVPVSFALTGPVSTAIGVSATLFVAGIVGSAVVAGIILFVPALRSEPQGGPTSAWDDRA